MVYMAFKVSWLGILLARLRVMEVVFGRSSFGGSGFWLGMGHMSELLLIRVKIKSGEQGGREEKDPMEDFVEMEMVRMTFKWTSPGCSNVRDGGSIQGYRERK